MSGEGPGERPDPAAMGVVSEPAVLKNHDRGAGAEQPAASARPQGEVALVSVGTEFWL